MKILFVIARYFPYSGLQTDFLRAAEAAADRGHEVTCLVGSWEGKRPDGLRILTAQLPGTGEADDLDALETAYRDLLMRESFDRTAAFELIPGVDFYFAGFDCLGSAPEDADPQLLAREKAVFSPGASPYIFYLVTPQINAFFGVYGTEPSRFLRLPPGMNPACGRVPDPDSVRIRKRAELGLLDGERLGITAAHDMLLKGVDRILISYAELPPERRNRLRFFVTGILGRGECEKLAAELGIADRVIFDGNRPDLPELLCAADYLVHPARREAAGSILIEAIASGLPVVCTEVCGFQDIVLASGGHVLNEPFYPGALTAELDYLAGISDDGLHYWRQQVLTYAHGPADFYRRADVLVNFIQSHSAGDRP
ncbi:MAG: glycosyltransferase family 4 protein [Lentisphaeria bacterium]|nr:glycosyltransferase family 4 protein [Lentisphaeria bacterium]